MRRFWMAALAWSLFLPALLVHPQRTAAQSGDAWSLIAEINALRASYGLPPYEINSSLMSAAQAQSQWQAEIGSWTHSGPDGSRPHDRAVAWGYGGGQQVFISENVAMGNDLLPSAVVYEYWQDSVHLETMISSNYRDIGAGVAQAGGKVYYTIDVGYIAGGAGNSPPPAGTPPPTSIPVMSIRVATPRADGSIIHMVESGQFLINIAKAYEIPLPDLLSINGLTDQTVIFPGDKLFIQLPWTVTPTSELATLDTPGPGRSARASSGTPRPKQSTQTPTKAKKIITIAPAALAPPVASLPSPQALERSVPEVRQHSTGPDFLLVTMLVLGVTGTALVALGSALKRSA